MHETHIDSILPDEDDDAKFWHNIGTPDDLPSPAQTPSSSTREYPITDLDGKPQFNLTSAEALLEHFHSMIEYFPCIAIQRGITVKELAANKPFLLLAILTSVSAFKTPQGHSLYDAEFRKILGLKFVAAGERTTELLQGLLVYCIWYPFQIRPKSKQMFQYVRMAGDLVRDLGMDEDSQDSIPIQTAEDHLERMRAHLGYLYLDAMFTFSWQPQHRQSASKTSWILKCCADLERAAINSYDLSLVALARIGVMYTQAASTISTAGNESEEQRRLLLLGLETRLQQLQQQLPASILNSRSVKLSILYMELYLNSAGILKKPRPRKSSREDESLDPEPLRLITATGATRRFLDHILTLNRQEFSTLTAVDWCRIVITIIFAVRLSLPLANCPEFDTSWARSQIGLSDFLNQICAQHDMEPSPGVVDTLHATRVILKVVQRKFEQRVQAAEVQEAATMQGMGQIGCPLLDGSLDQYLAQWNPETNSVPFTTSSTAMTDNQSGNRGQDRTAHGGQQPVFHDIWATMTMGWANSND
ncbi:hypothetical protein CC79DRAFT_1060891 [Sarocladium strictum]